MEKITQESTLDLRVTENGSCVELAHILTMTRNSHAVTIEKSSIPALIAALQKFAE